MFELNLNKILAGTRGINLVIWNSNKIFPFQVSCYTPSWHNSEILLIRHYVKITFFDVPLIQSILTKFKVLWKLRRFPAEDKRAHNIPCLVISILSHLKNNGKKLKNFDEGSIIPVLKLRNCFSKSISTFPSMCAKLM